MKLCVSFIITILFTLVTIEWMFVIYIRETFANNINISNIA